MTCSGSPSLHAILEESPSEDDSASSEGGGAWLPSLEGVQDDDTCYPTHYYTTTGGDPDVSDHIDDAAADHYTNTLP
jgi:hypothetical protein